MLKARSKAKLLVILWLVAMLVINKAFEKDLIDVSTIPTQKQQPYDKFIEYSMYQDRPYNLTFSRKYRCKIGQGNQAGPIQRVALADPFRELLNLQTFFRTNLKIFMFGDSLAMQFTEFLADAGGADEYKILKYSWKTNPHFLVTKLAGGGAIATMRMTKLWNRTLSNRKLPNSPEGGWRPKHFKMIREETAKQNSEDGLANFDTMIVRIPHGWIELDEIHISSLKETLTLGHEHLGVKSAIILTLPVNNNVFTKQDLVQLHQVNAQIRGMAADWNQADADATGVEKVVIMDFGEWADESLAGRNKPLVNEIDVLARLNGTCGGKFPPSIPATCASPPVVTNQTDRCRQCDRNMISVDGMHWCMESIGGHFAASISCLLECTISASGQELRTCESKCTDQLLSMSFRDSIVRDS